MAKGECQCLRRRSGAHLSNRTFGWSDAHRHLTLPHRLAGAEWRGTKSDLFRDLLPRLNSASITLPRHDHLVSQLASLEHVTSRAGKVSISHPPNGHDDVANAVAGVASRAASLDFDTSLSWVDGPTLPVRDWREMRAQRLHDHLRRCGVSW
jgi:hypothetical protein